MYNRVRSLQQGKKGTNKKREQTELLTNELHQLWQKISSQIFMLHNTLEGTSFHFICFAQAQKNNNTALIVVIIVVLAPFSFFQVLLMCEKH